MSTVCGQRRPKRAVLPCCPGDMNLRLVRLDEAIPERAVDLWLLTHPDLYETARVRDLLDFLADARKKQRALLAGMA